MSSVLKVWHRQSRLVLSSINIKVGIKDNKKFSDKFGLCYFTSFCERCMKVKYF